MIAKYGSKDNENRTYQLAKLTVQDDFIKDLYQYGSYFSAQTLQVMANVWRSIKEKTAKKEASLEEILKAAR